jgi:hypothetical protein
MGILKLAPDSVARSPVGTCWIAMAGTVIQRDGDFVLCEQCETFEELVAVVAKITEDLARILREGEVRFNRRKSN